MRRLNYLLLSMLVASMSHAQDSSTNRYYFSWRARDTDPLADVHDLWGISFGYNYNEYVGAELAIDTLELELSTPRDGALGEYSILPIIPELRLRYPLFKGRLVPYFVGGAGVAFTQFNDRKPAGFGKEIDWESSTFAAMVGGGLEYYVADNVALGLEGRYMFADPQTYHVDGVRYEKDPSSFLLQLSLRILFPELDPKPLLAARNPEPSPLYFGVRFGGALPAPRALNSDLKLQPEPSAFFDALNQFYGVSFGANITPHLGAEISAEGFESRLEVDGLGEIGEYATYQLLAQLRARWPLGKDGRWTPYVLAGAGAVYSEFNDRLPAGQRIHVEANEVSPALSVGAGLEAFLASNFSLNLESKYTYTFGQTIDIANRPTSDVNLGALVVSLGFRLYFGNLSP